MPGWSWTGRRATSPCWAAELDDEGAQIGEFDDTPAGFGRIAAATARSVLLQRLQDASSDVTFQQFAAKEGDLVSGIVQQSLDPRVVKVDLGELEAALPPSEQAPGEPTPTAAASASWSRRCGAGTGADRWSPSPGRTRTWCASSSPWRSPEIADGSVEIKAVAREAGHRTKIAVVATKPGVNAKGACIGPMGQRVRAVMSELHGEKIDIIDWTRIRRGSSPTRSRRRG